MSLLDKPILIKDPNYNDLIISFDIETAPSEGLYYNPYAPNSIIHKTRDWFVMGMGYKYLGKPEVHRLFIWNLPEWKKVFCKECKRIHHPEIAEEILMKKIWEALNPTKIRIGWNSDNFDIKKLNAKFIKYNQDPLDPYKSIDAMKLHKRVAKTDKNGLGDVGQDYGLGGKMETSKNLTIRCLEGDKEAQKEMEEYCDRDVILAEKIYLKERGWNKNSPYINMTIGRPQSCRNCGGEQLHKHGLEWDGLSKYQRWKCLNCGANLRSIPDKAEKPYR